MSSLKHKVGDRVWVEFVVAEVDGGDKNWPYRLESMDGDYWMSEEAVQAFSQGVNTSVDDVQVGDVVVNQDKLYTVLSVGGDRVCVHTDGAYLLKQDIEAIFRRVYTKKKSVDEMTREELIEYVKQLEGGK